VKIETAVFAQEPVKSIKCSDVKIEDLQVTEPESAAPQSRQFSQLERTQNRAEPFSVVSLLTHDEALDRPHDIELLGNLAFIPGKGGSLAIIDVSNPELPKILWYRHSSQLDNAETVLPMSFHWLFVGTNDFHSIDVLRPRNPVFENGVSDRKKISRINGMVRRGPWIFAACKHGWINVFDVRERKEPLLVAAADVRGRFGIDSPHDVGLYGDYVIVPDPQGFDRSKVPGKLALLKVTDDHTHTLMNGNDWELTSVIVSRALSGANRVQISGKNAFIGASNGSKGGRMVVVDLSDPMSPVQAAVTHFAPDDGWGPNGLTIAGKIVFLAGGQTVEAIDISNPEQPVMLARQRFPEEMANMNPRYPGEGASGHDLIYRDGYLYVTGQNDCCLLILRVERDCIRELAGL
jgi:hypothetical protein